MTRLYEVEIDAMKNNFELTAQKIGNVRQNLWHGTKASNLLSILKKRLDNSAGERRALHGQKCSETAFTRASKARKP